MKAGRRYISGRAGGTVFSLNRTGEVRFERGRTVFSRDGDGLAAELTCFVSPLDGAAVQLVSLRASPDAAVELEICSFLEAGLASQAAEEAHPAFSALFVQTRRLDAHAALAARRPQKPGERWPLLLHAAGTDARAGAIRLETARGAFLGRGERLDNPAALGTPCPEGDGETGAVLDACMSLRLPLRVEAGRDGAGMVCDRGGGGGRKSAVAVGAVHGEGYGAARAGAFPDAGRGDGPVSVAG